MATREKILYIRITDTESFPVDAEHECMCMDFSLANQIRHDRLKVMEDRGQFPDLVKYFKIIDKLTGVEHGR